MRPDDEQRCWVYGIVRADDAVSVPERGVTDAPVRLVQGREIAAVVSPLDVPRVRGSRAALSAHESVVEAIARETTVLPMQFGVVLPDERSVVEELLQARRAEFASLLAEMRDKVEWRVKATYRENVAVHDAARRDPRIGRLASRLKGRSEAATYYDRIQLGELVATAIETVRYDDARRFDERISRHAVATAPLPTQSTDVAFATALLVERSRVERFDAAVEEFAAASAERLTFELVGPLAPWDFFTTEGAEASSAMAGTGPGGR